MNSMSRDTKLESKLDSRMQEKDNGWVLCKDMPLTGKNFNENPGLVLLLGHASEN
jgi:hypothetical protein